MTAKSMKFLQVSVTVFKVLAWVVLVLETLAGLNFLIRGGDPFVIGDYEIPARLVGVMNFVAAGTYFFSFWLVSTLIQLLLDIRKQLPGAPTA